MTERILPEVGHVYFPVRVMDETEGTFKNVWQQVAGGSEVGYVDLNLKPYTLPEHYTAQPLRGGVGYFLPGIEKDPDPDDTKARRAAAQAAIDAANALANAAGATAGAVVLTTPIPPDQATA
jgi:hypothetical protein